MPSGFSVVADVTVQPNVDAMRATVFDSDVVWRDFYEHRPLFASKGSNLLLMACLDAMVLPVTFAADATVQPKCGCNVRNCF